MKSFDYSLYLDIFQNVEDLIYLCKEAGVALDLRLSALGTYDLSITVPDVVEAIAKGFPAAHMISGSKHSVTGVSDLHLAFRTLFEELVQLSLEAQKG